MQSSAGRQPSDTPFDPIASLNKTVELNSSFLIAQRDNLHSSEESLAKASFFDDFVSGNKIVLEADRDQDQGKYDKLAYGHKRLIKAQTKVNELYAQGKTVEAKELATKAIAEHKKLLKSEVGDNQAFHELYTEQKQSLESSERRTQIVAETSVAAAATVATIATGGAVGFVIGTTVGASVGALKNTAGAAVEVFAYDKDVLDASIQVLEQTGADTYTAAKASVSAATGAAVAGYFATPVTLAAKAGVASVAGATATATSLAINTRERAIKAEESFQKSLEGWSGIKEKDIPRLRKEHYIRQGFDWDTFAKEGAIDLAIGIVSGGQGGIATAARDATKSAIKQAVITGAEVGGTIAIAATASRVKHGTINSDTLIEEAAGATLATLAGGAVTPSSSKTTQTPVKEPVVPSHETATTAAKPQVKTTVEPAQNLRNFSEQLAKEAKAHSEAAIDQIKTILPEDLRDSVTGRGKSPSSIESKLKRAFEHGDKLDTLDEARARVGDLVGTRLVLKDTSPANIQRVADALANGVKKGELTITEFNNYQGKDTKPYFNNAQVKEIQKAALGRGQALEVNSGPGAVKDTGYTTAQMNITHKDGTEIQLEILGEFQIRGLAVHDLSEAEHIVYDIKSNKNPAATNPHLKVEIEELTQIIKGLSPEQNAAYDKYVVDLFEYARATEDGLIAPRPVLPAGIPTQLAIENLEKLHSRFNK